ncbi:hypothetical protein QZH41_012225 [Actinostola sp. cb2023]|nr:hypothetical protein QZH41_012225 [Actinostola sp. cb2023]
MLAPGINAIFQMFAKKGYRCPLGLFFHIPFPPRDVFDQLQHSEVVLQGILGSDRVTFQTKEYSHNFLGCCKRLKGCSVDFNAEVVWYEGRKIDVRVTPVGHSYDFFSALSHGTLSEHCRPEIKELYNTKGNQTIIIGAERLDYTKGLEYRALAYQRFLNKYPQHNGKVTYLQIAVPARPNAPGFTHLKHKYEEFVTRVNSELVAMGYQSRIKVIMGKVSQRDLAILYKMSDVAMVTTLRDGMNLVAFEYVACQTLHPGVLILSPYAGAAETLVEALKVRKLLTPPPLFRLFVYQSPFSDPYDIDHMADTLHRAVVMPTEERKARMENLQKSARGQSVTKWVRLNLDPLINVHE